MISRSKHWANQENDGRIIVCIMIKNRVRMMKNNVVIIEHAQ
jgi:hypothetical protein